MNGTWCSSCDFPHLISLECERCGALNPAPLLSDDHPSPLCPDCEAFGRAVLAFGVQGATA